MRFEGKLEVLIRQKILADAAKPGNEEIRAAIKEEGYIDELIEGTLDDMAEVFFHWYCANA